MALFKKRTVTSKSRQKEPTKELSDSESPSEDEGPIVKKRVKTSQTDKVPKAAKADLLDVEYKHSGTKETTNLSDATKQDRLAVEARQEALESAEREKQREQEEYQQGVYTGKANYAKFFKPREGAVKFGPVKPAASNVRSTTVIDYQPDVCKDYKQTGFCGYGDSCKFLHSREDYKAGWQLDREWEADNFKKKTGGGDDSAPNTAKDDKAGDEDMPDIPFKCVICKQDYKEPVVTACKHYFCEACFFDAYRKDPGCFICGKNTNGIATPAKDLKKLLAKRVATITDADT